MSFEDPDQSITDRQRIGTDAGTEIKTLPISTSGNGHSAALIEEIELLRKNQEMLQVALQAASMGTWRYHLADGRWELDEMAMELYGIDVPITVHDDEVVGQVLHPEDIPNMWLAVAAALDLSGDGRYMAEYRTHRKDGGWRWLKVWGLVQFQGTGADRKPWLLTGASRDITDQKEAGSALRESEERYRAVVEAQTELLCRFEPQGRILFVNSAYARACGTNPSQMIGCDIWQFIPEEEQEGIRTALDALSPKHPEALIENRFMTTKGLCWMLWTNRALKFDEKGNVSEVQATGMDITARKRSEALLEAQKQAMELVVMGSPLQEIFSVLTGIIEQQSPVPSVASILLLDENGVLRHGAAPGLPDEYNQAIDGIVARADLGTCSRAAVIGDPVLTSDIENDPHWATIKHLPLALGLKSAWSQPIKARDGVVLGTLGTYFKECREPSHYERQVVELISRTAALALEHHKFQEALQENDRRKDEFLATLAHELRNPLAPLRSALDIIHEDIPGPELISEMTTIMDRQLGQLQRLVDDLLDVSRINRGKIHLRMEASDLAAIAGEAVEAARPMFEARKQRLEIRLPERPVHLNADRTRLTQVLGNLLNNASKFTPANGRVELDIEQYNGTAVIRVKDDGKGIPADKLNEIFNMFSQVDPPIEREHGGLGIGLSLVKSLVQLHGGKVEALSDGIDKGSEFIVRIPMSDQ